MARRTQFVNCRTGAPKPGACDELTQHRRRYADRQHTVVFVCGLYATNVWFPNPSTGSCWCFAAAISVVFGAGRHRLCPKCPHRRNRQPHRPFGLGLFVGPSAAFYIAFIPKEKACAWVRGALFFCIFPGVDGAVFLRLAGAWHQQRHLPANPFRLGSRGSPRRVGCAVFTFIRVF